ncbi:MAG: ChbG/HpnK family deacetylase [Terriglobales bacterium]
MRRLIVNADDFGLTAGVNRGIVEAHSGGIVTSSTLMANASALDDAIRMGASSPHLSLGCHVVLVDGAPVMDPGRVPTLLSGKRNGQFEVGIAGFAIRALRGRLDADQMEAEVTAQIRKLQAVGVQVSHLDTHKHTHIFPQVLHPILRAARACGVRAIRNPFGRVAFSQIANRPSLWRRYGQVKMLNAWAAAFARTVADAGMNTPDGSLGIVATGSMDDRMLRLILENLPEGTWELVCHPGHNDDNLARIRTRLRESREVELQLLTSAAARKWLMQGGVQLISYHDL